MKNRNHQRREVGAAVFAVLVFCLMLCSGCATRHARSSGAYADEPHAYPATRYALHGQVAKHWVERLPESKSSGYWLFPDDLMYILVRDTLVGTVGYVYSLVVEVPISLVTDTVLLRADLRRISAFEAGEDVFAGALFGHDWPVPAETLRAHYRWINCDPLIRRLLESPGTPHRREKILCLIEAGAGLPYIAGHDGLDAEMAARIMDQVAVEHPERYGTLNLLARNPLTPADVMIAIVRAGPYENWAPSPVETLIRNPSVSPAVLDALAVMAENPSILEAVARHSGASAATLDHLAQRKIPRVNRAVAAQPLVQLQTIEAMKEVSLDDPEFDEALSLNPKTPPAMLLRIVQDVSLPWIGKLILLNVSRHPAATDEILRLVLEKCDELDQKTSAPDERLVIHEAREAASKRLNRQ